MTSDHLSGMLRERTYLELRLENSPAQSGPEWRARIAKLDAEIAAHRKAQQEDT